MLMTNHMMIDADLLQQIELHGQQHVLQFWGELDVAARTRLIEQLTNIDWKLIKEHRSGHAKQTIEVVDEKARLATPAHLVRRPKTEKEFAEWNHARQIGESVLSAGKVAAVLLAGGQGTRLGFDHPKGMFPIGPVSQGSLFKILAEKIVALSSHFGTTMTYLIMTSDGTHDETISYFQQNAFFGLNRDDVFFFQQGYSPCLDSQTGELLLAEKGALRMNPDGHGGLLGALLKAGMFDELRRRGVEYLYSHQVDNPLAKVCDPEFIGFHVQNQADVSTKVVAKTGPEEKVGVAVDRNGQTAIIEYSDLPMGLANDRDESGELRFWAGSTAIHVFNRSFLESIATSANSLPWHRAFKKIPHFNKRGEAVFPEVENGVKFERFIFDTLPLAKTALIVETVRAEEFAPLKNRVGDYSAEYVRDCMIREAVRWLNDAGVKVPDDAIVEISPRFAISASELQTRESNLLNLSFAQPVYLRTSDSLEPMDNCKSQNNQEQSPSNSRHETSDPLVFDTYYRPQVWGGRGLELHLGRDLPDDGPYGEAWEISSQPLHESRVVEGPRKGLGLNDFWKLLGRGLKGQDDFPLLVKWLECRELLSLQVHPDDQMARRMLNQPFGKSEAWVVISAEPTARVYAGLKPGITRDFFLSQIKRGRLEDCVHSFVPVAGDCISLPAGTIHAAGGGLIVAEVQQSSDATFRLHDWNRLGLDGKPRLLQIELALEAINWNQGPLSPLIPAALETNFAGVRAERLVDENGFRLERYFVDHSMPSPYVDELTIWMVLEGKGALCNPETSYRREFAKGMTTIISPGASHLYWESLTNHPSLTLLCTRLRPRGV